MTSDIIHTADGEEIPVTDDINQADVYATGLTVSASQKVNLGSYENAEPFASIRAEVRPAVALSDGGAIEHLRGRCDALRRVVGYHVTAEIERYREGQE